VSVAGIVAVAKRDYQNDFSFTDDEIADEWADLPEETREEYLERARDLIEAFKDVGGTESEGINYEALRELQSLCYRNAASKGFHDDRPDDAKVLVGYQGNKMMLMVGELAEAHEELRKGHLVTETYYPARDLPASLVYEAGPEVARQLIDAEDAGKLKKPEGVPSELADTVIRILDFCGAEGIDLAGIIAEKLAYNATRERLHGKKF